MQRFHKPDESVSAQLGLWDAVSIIIGIVVGTSIFKTPSLVFSNVSGPWMGMGAWALGGLLALAGALCYAELATTYPRTGGDYVYLTRAYGPLAGFLFGWAQLGAILTGSIGIMAYAFADYAANLWQPGKDHTVWLAVAAVVALTVLNLLGVVIGKTAQNILSVIKVVGLLGITAAGILWGGSASLAVENPVGPGGFGLAMVFVLYAYGGWNDAAFVAAEVRNRQVNIPRALLLGTGGITLVYLLVNGAYLWGLGFEALRKDSTPAATVLGLVFGSGGAKGMSLLVMASALGAVNGLIFTGARVYAGLGADHRIFALLGRWYPRWGPVWSLVAQSAVAVLLIVAVGAVAGRAFVDRCLGVLGLAPLPWDKYFGGFETLLAATAPVFWGFFLLTGLSLFVLRWKDRHIERPFAVPFFPVAPFLFCAMCVYMLYSSIAYAGQLSILGAAPLAIGLPLYFVSRSATPRDR
jgi:amino acid transporter